MAIAYLDASAYVKLPLGEAEMPALSRTLDQYDAAASSVVLAVEAVRACARAGRDYAAQAEQGLSLVSLIPLSDAVIAHAQQVGSPMLRSLDAIHLASAASLGDSLGVILTYDQRLADAARALGLPVAGPA